MRFASFVLIAAACLGAQDRYPFETPQSAEAVAEIDLASPGSDWAITGREAATALVRLDGKREQHIIVWGGKEKQTYRVFLGRVTPGRHDITVERSEKFSARGSGLEVSAVRLQLHSATDPSFGWLSHAPVMYARVNTVGRFSDVPLGMFCERLDKMLQYSVIFSNEDGGTSTRTLMARWGRATDIEYVYRVYLDSAGKVMRRTVQGPDHKELDFGGPFEDNHPLLMPVTDNNMVAGASMSPLRFQPAATMENLADASRESIMDANPVMYEVMAKELLREGKLRSFGTTTGELISDPGNYAYVDYRAKHQNSAFNVVITLRDGRAFSSDLGRIDFTIWRDGTVRSAVELPPGTRVVDIASLGFQCVVPPPEQKGSAMAHSGTCVLERVNKLFFLTERYRPSLGWFNSGRSVQVPTGHSIVFANNR